MQDYKINLRIKNILLKVCSQSDYVTVSSIAKDLGISAKTVLREIPEVENWMRAHDCSLDKKTGLGIRFKGSDEKKEEIINILNGVKDEEIYSPSERRVIILSELLQSKEPVKLYNFTRILKVTETTISNDLDKAEMWFNKHNVTLVRRPGLGVYIEGTESNKRKAIISLIYENADENQMLELIRKSSGVTEVSSLDLNFLAKTRLLNLIDSKTINKLEVLIREVEKNMNYKLADSAFVGLVVHMALAIKRISKNERIKIREEVLEDLRGSAEYSMANILGKSISESFEIDVPEDEIGYITMHIKGSKNLDINTKGGTKTIGNFELVRLAKEIIKTAERETGFFLEQDERLMVGLVNHLGPAISRLKMNLEIRNPLLENIRAQYPELLRVSEKCVKIIEDALGIKMPEAEIAYITMHLGAAIENSGTLPKHTYRVVLACSAGIGTSTILATRIEKEYENIQIVDTISTLRVEEEWLRDEDIEFIISTVKMDKCILPVVTVNPLLFEEDKNKISNMIKVLKSNGSGIGIKKKKEKNLKEKLNTLNVYSQGIISILDNFFLEEDSTSIDVPMLIEHIGEILERHRGLGSKDRLLEALMDREEKGSIVITGHEAILFHCRTSAVNELYFGALKIAKNLSCINGRDEAEEVRLGIVMLAPEGCSKYQIEVISYVSKMLIEKPDFIEALKKGCYEDAYDELSNVLKEFYKMKVNN